MTIEESIQSQNLPLSRKLTINLLYTANWATEILTETLKPYELSLQQFNVLRILRGQKGIPANLSTINDRMVSKMSNTTRLVDKLIKKNLVHRAQCPSNRRKIEITITPDGLSLLKSIDSAVDGAEDKITQQLSENEREQLNTMLNTLRH
ncbi:MAG: MarR family transcriptional regulator [Dokdonia sp.]|jgi:DNA-binding MarR family transcriptional regulator|nr:MarR family transcriptional regulator [Cytophagaceae bacterium]